MIMRSVKVIATLLAVTIVTSVITFPSVDAGKGIRVIGSMRGNEGNVLILVQNASINDLYSLKIEYFSGAIQLLTAPQGWWVHHGGDPDRSAYIIYSNLVYFETRDAPVGPHESMRFNIRISPSEDLKLKFKWTGYDSGGNEIAKGGFVTTNRLIKIESTKIEISEHEAISIVKNWVAANETRKTYVYGDVESSFAFLKYNGTVNGDPYFIWYQADPNSTIVEEMGQNVVFSDSHNAKYLLNKYVSENKVDRFAWVIFFYGGIPPSNNRHYFVDANSGVMIGHWTECPECVCHHNDKK
jgi:hypothetical protein